LGRRKLIEGTIEERDRLSNEVEVSSEKFGKEGTELSSVLPKRLIGLKRTNCCVEYGELVKTNVCEGDWSDLNLIIPIAGGG